MKRITPIFLLVLVASQIGAQSKIHFYEDTALMRIELQKHLPLGSDTVQARKIMTKNNFSCTRMTDAQFAAGSRQYDHINYLYCDCQKPGLFISRRWQIALVEERGKIKNILVSFGIIGP